MNTILRFTINGNQNDPSGNPIPYKRTLAKVYSKVSKDYHQWLEYIRAEFDRASLAVHATRESYPYPDFTNLPPDVSFSCRIHWKDNKHGDVDNVLKGILDALFKNDKCVFAIQAIGTMSASKQGRVDVKIEFLDIHSADTYLIERID